jgi:hypothetical protein
MNPTAFVNDRRDRIAELRRTGRALEARLMLEDTLAQLETYLDPQIAVDRQEQLAAERARYTSIIRDCHRMADDIDTVIGF